MCRVRRRGLVWGAARGAGGQAAAVRYLLVYGAVPEVRVLGGREAAGVITLTIRGTIRGVLRTLVHGVFSMADIRSPQRDSIVACPTTAKEYRVIDTADRVWPDKFKSPTNCPAGTRLWVLCGFNLDDEPIMKTTDQLRKFRLIETGIRASS